MTQTSIGFAGTIGPSQWATLAAYLGRGNSLRALGDLPITAATTKGTFVVGVNSGDGLSGVFGDGVMTVFDAAETVQDTAGPLSPANGQWYLMVLNRMWAAKTTSVLFRKGATTAAAAPGSTLPALPASVMRSVGTNADIPLAWVWLGSAAAAPIIVPLLLPPESIAPHRGTTAERDALYGPTIGTYFGSRLRAQQQDYRWANSTTGRIERYVAQFDATNNPIGGGAATWRPIDAVDAFVVIEGTGTAGAGGTASVAPSGKVTRYASSDVTVFPVRTDGLVKIVIPGWYYVEGDVIFQANSSGDRLVVITRNDADFSTDVSNRQDATATNSKPMHAGGAFVSMAAGDVVKLKASASGAGANLTYQSRLIVRLARIG